MATRKAASANAESRRQGARPAQRRTLLRANRPVDASAALHAALAARVIGQDHAIDALVSSWGRVLAGLRDPRRPLLTALLMGPTGVGKTETALGLAAALFGTETALHRINCEEYTHGHEVAKLMGSPPGYVGGDVEALLAQKRIDRPHWQARQAAGTAGGSAPAAEALIERVHDAEGRLHSILLFDEVEKAHPTLWSALLGILEEGQVTLGDNSTTDLTRSVILMTTNVGSREIGTAIGRVPLGFASATRTSAAPELEEIARAAARNVFPAEFLNRFDETLVYRPLGDRELGLVFDKFLGAVNQRAHAQAGVPLLIRASAKAKAMIVAAGTDPVLGARPLRRAVERMIVDPVSRLLAGGQIGAGDVVEVDRKRGRLRFYRLPRSGRLIVT
jgi:ATP-dependent Clp protease ATP-binding subunit ClpA